MEELEKKEILETYKWIKIKKYRDDNTLSWEERYRLLEQHHIEETNFLIDKVREIVKNNLEIVCLFLASPEKKCYICTVPKKQKNMTNGQIIKSIKNLIKTVNKLKNGKLNYNWNGYLLDTDIPLSYFLVIENQMVC